MSNEWEEIKTDGVGSMVIKAMEKHLQDKLRSKGISTVTVKAVRKAGKPVIEFFGPEDDVKKAKTFLGR